MTTHKNPSKNKRNADRGVREHRQHARKEAVSPWQLVESMSRYVRI